MVWLICILNLFHFGEGKNSTIGAFKKPKVDWAIFNIDSVILIYGFILESKTFILLNFIVKCEMFVINKYIFVTNFES